MNSALLEDGLNAALDDPCLQPALARDGFEKTLTGIDPDEAWDYYLKLRYLHCDEVGRGSLLTTDTPLFPDQPPGPNRVPLPLPELSEIEKISRIFDGSRIPVAPVPLPPAGLLLGAALAGGFAFGRRKPW